MSDKCCPRSIAKNVLSKMPVFKDGTPPFAWFEVCMECYDRNSSSGGQTDGNGGETKIYM